MKITRPACNFLAWGVASVCAAQTCQQPSAGKLAQLSTYVEQRYHVPSAELVLADNAQANGSCYWKLRYKSPVLKEDVSLYLTPDEQYLVPALFDLSIDPIAEETQRAREAASELLAGSPPSIGRVDAPITIVEFSDFQCPYCKRMSDVFEKDLTPEERSRVRIVYRNFPLSIHPWARSASEISACIGEQNAAAFWDVNSYLFDNQKTISADNLRTSISDFIASRGIDLPGLDKCIDGKLSVPIVNSDIDLGRRFGVHVTPTVFVNGIKYEGAKNITQLRALLAVASDSALTGISPTSK